MHAPTWIKICGVTLPADVEAVIDAGAEAIGLNFVFWSKRRIDVPLARQLVECARGRVETVGVVSDLSEAQVRELIERVPLDRVQLHGQESPEFLAALGGVAFKAAGVASASDVTLASTFPGELLLVDTAVGTTSGGTGKTFDWSLVTELCRSRKVVVAGGLQPENVKDAVLSLCPFGVDVASGVEQKGRPGIKDHELIRAFVAAVRQADAELGRLP
jgi:phosphoribosylanthranilate isomerase